MKPTTTYPTKHPHWIDEPEYLETITKKKRFGISFTTAFLLVLAIHIAGVGGIFAFSNQKPKAAAPAKSEAVAANPPAPKSDALARNEWPEPEAKPKVVATPPPVKKLVTTAKVKPKSEPKPVAVVAEKPKSPASAISKPTPVVANTAPRQPQAADAARGADASVQIKAPGERAPDRRRAVQLRDDVPSIVNVAAFAYRREARAGAHFLSHAAAEMVVLKRQSAKQKNCAVMLTI